MHFKHFPWTVAKLDQLRDHIDERPQYQRGDAWDDKKRALLIDSILNGFDIPKIYLRHTNTISTFDYEVADGQQRLTAIWNFLDGSLILDGMSNGYARLNGKTVAELSIEEKKHLMEYSLITTVVYNATNDEVRELFRRLQLGVRLTPAELRNSMASALGNEIRAMALTHPFFSNSPFSPARYKTDDLLAHAFAIVIYQRKNDVKAPDLKSMYEAFATSVSASHAKQVNDIIHFLDAMQGHVPKCIATKWGFVDLVGVLATRKLNSVDPALFAAAYANWENDRADKLPNLSALAAAKAGSRDRHLFDYISAFQKEGATRKNLEARFQILNRILP